jgi:ribosomal protein S18 acetylase RimI-like enzyme
MTEGALDLPNITRAGVNDVSQIVELMAANQLDRGGSLSALYSIEQVASLLCSMPVVVARDKIEVVGFLMTSPRSVTASPPIIQAMLAAYPGADDAYVYGPVCVAAEWRGRGLAQAMFTELRRHLPGREGILFVRNDNDASLRAHVKMGMTAVAHFIFRDTTHTVFAYSG